MNRTNHVYNTALLYFCENKLCMAHQPKEETLHKKLEFNLELVKNVRIIHISRAEMIENIVKINCKVRNQSL